MKSLLTMLLVLAFAVVIKEDVQLKLNKKKHVVMDDIFIYIREHLIEDISLERLENEFYISRYHIVKFKKMTGETPHSYIIQRADWICTVLYRAGKVSARFMNLEDLADTIIFSGHLRKSMVLLQCNIIKICRSTGMKDKLIKTAVSCLK